MQSIFKFRPKNARDRLATFLIAFGLLGIAISSVFCLVDRNVNTPATPDPHQAAPSSTRPNQSDIAAYQVPPTLPRYITIPSIKVPKSRVLALGLLPNNQIATPDNVYDAGWYRGSVKPGQQGAMFVFGHVSSWQAHGIFYHLKSLRPGDKVIVTRGDGKVFTYEVISSKVYPYNHVDMHAALSPIKPSLPGLNLMTCTGHVIKGTNEFNQRLVVFTSLAK